MTKEHILANAGGPTADPVTEEGSIRGGCG